jgi:hypothetical protein
MNDEDFARHAFAAAFRSGQTGEPPTLPDVELLAQHGRRANRTRHGLYAAGTTVVAGVAVAGVVTGPTLLGLGSPSPSGTGSAAQGPTLTAKASPSATSSALDGPLKPSPGVPCATPPTINWVSVVNAALPAGVTATADHDANCMQTSDGSRSVEALFKLSTGDVTLQVDVMTGPKIAAKLGAAAGMIGIGPASPAPSESLDPATLANLRASKMAAAASAAGGNSAAAIGAPPSAPPSLSAAAIASLEAQKLALASARATASPAPGAADGGGITGAGGGGCSAVDAGESTCVSHLTKGSISVVEAQVLRTGASPLVVDVTASNGKDDAATPAPGQLPSDAAMQAIAQAVAARF